MSLKEQFEWRDRVDGDKHNKDHFGWDTEKIGVIGDQIVCRIRSRLKKGSTWSKDYKASEVYYEDDGGSSSRHITSGGMLSSIQSFCEKYLFGALNDRIVCSSCGLLMDISGSARTEAMREAQMCFSCLEWTNRKKKLNDPLVVIVDSVWYTIDTRENMNNSCKGFAGAEFEISYLDDRPNRKTTNLRHGGKCPDHLRSEFPDNAVFIRKN